MGPGPGGTANPDGGTRFSLLKDNEEEFPTIESSNKRKRMNNGAAPRRVTYTSDTAPKGIRYVVLKPSESAKPILANPFKLSNEVNAMLKSDKALDVVSMRNGDILIKCRSAVQSSKLLSFKNLPISQQPISITEHEKLNKCQGKIFRHDLKSLTDDEIMSGLQDQLVTEVKRVQKKAADGKLIDTGLFILTFNTTVLPEYVYAGYLRLKVTPYIPNPLRCTNCLTYGHSKKNCTRNNICAKCGAVAHDGECETTLCCINCTRAGVSDNRHSALSRKCPVFMKEYEIQKIRTLEGVSIRDAKKKYESRPKVPLSFSFSEVVAKKSCGCVCNCQNNQRPKPTVSTLTQNSLANKVPPPNLNPVVLLQKLNVKSVAHTTTKPNQTMDVDPDSPASHNEKQTEAVSNETASQANDNIFTLKDIMTMNSGVLNGTDPGGSGANEHEHMEDL